LFNLALKIGTLVLLFVVSYTSAQCNSPAYCSGCPDGASQQCCLDGLPCLEGIIESCATYCQDNPACGSCVSFVMTISRRPCEAACL
jgi:hypothetical protein